MFVMEGVPRIPIILLLVIPGVFSCGSGSGSDDTGSDDKSDLCIMTSSIPDKYKLCREVFKNLTVMYVQNITSSTMPGWDANITSLTDVCNPTCLQNCPGCCQNLTFVACSFRFPPCPITPTPPSPTSGLEENTSLMMECFDAVTRCRYCMRGNETIKEYYTDYCNNKTNATATPQDKSCYDATTTEDPTTTITTTGLGQTNTTNAATPNGGPTVPSKDTYIIVGATAGCVLVLIGISIVIAVCRNRKKRKDIRERLGSVKYDETAMEENNPAYDYSGNAEEHTTTDLYTDVNKNSKKGGNEKADSEGVNIGKATVNVKDANGSAEEYENPDLYSAVVDKNTKHAENGSLDLVSDNAGEASGNGGEHDSEVYTAVNKKASEVTRYIKEDKTNPLYGT